MATYLLKGCPLFYELYDDEIEHVIDKCNVLSYTMGQDIVAQGEEGHELFVILTGKAELVKKHMDMSIPIGTLVKGDVFGELVLINENIRTASVRALTQCDVLVIDYDTIFSLFEADTKTFAVILLNLARLLTKRLKSTHKLVEDFAKDGTEAA